MAKDNIAQRELLPLIEHKVEDNPIDQRATDGYVNATAMCKAAGKQINDYARLKATPEYLDALSAETGIPVSDLIQTIKGGVPQMQGTWVHPQVAIHLAQWLSPQFAVKVTQWVFDWMNGGGIRAELPDHIKRYLVNRGKIPSTHFSMLDQMTLKLLAGLEQHGYQIPNSMMPDISLGRMFSKWLRDNGYEPDGFPSYSHEFIDGRPIVQARLYPNELMTEFNLRLESWIVDGRALKYFGDRDQAAIAPLKALYAELPEPEKKTELSHFNKKLKKAINNPIN